MTNEFFNLGKFIANMPEDKALAYIEASSFPEGEEDDNERRETKRLLRKRYYSWQDKKEISNQFKERGVRQWATPIGNGSKHSGKHF